MKSLFLFLSACCFFVGEIKSQKLWDGGGGNDRWSNAANWYPDGVPFAKEDVILNNRIVKGSYRVMLPGTRVSIESMDIKPAAASPGGPIPTIELVLPASNAFNNAFVLEDSLHLYRGAIFRHAGGAGSEQIGFEKGFVHTGSRWIHTSLAPNTYLREMIADTGVIEFNVPTATYHFNTTGLPTLRNLIFNGSEAVARGLAVVYTISPRGLIVQDSFHIKAGVTVRFLDNADLWMQGVHVIVDGTLDFSDPSNTLVHMYVVYVEKPSILEGSGPIRVNNRFLFELHMPATLILRRSVFLPYSSNLFIIRSDATLETGNYTIGGPGRFMMENLSTLRTPSPDGIWKTASMGPIRMATRTFADTCSFEYNGANVQHTGDALPDSVLKLIVNKPSGDLILTRPVFVRDSLKLVKGKINTSATALLTWSGKNNAFGSMVNNYGNAYGWEQSYVNGPMAIKMKDPGQLCAFPVGKGNVFAPIIFQKQFGGSATYTVEYIQLTPDFVTAVASPLHHISSIEYWKVRTTLSTFSPANADDGFVTLTWRPSSRIGTGFAERRDLRLAHFENSGAWLRWESVSSPAPPSDAGYGLAQFVTNPVTDFSPESFTLGSVSANNPMSPIDLVFSKARQILYPFVKQ